MEQETTQESSSKIYLANGDEYVPKTDLEVQKSVHPYDDFSTWLKADFTEAPWPKARTRAFQKEIDRLIGTNSRGESFVKLVWSGDRRYWYPYYSNWYSTGTPREDSLELRPVVLYRTHTLDNGVDYIDIYPPRWLLLQKIEPEQYAETWELGCYERDPLLSGPKVVRPLTPPKEYYVWFQTIASHAVHGDCCKAAESNLAVCYGRYREPAQADFDFLVENNRWRASSGRQRSDMPLTEETLKTITKEVAWYNAQMRDQKTKAASEAIMENPAAFVQPFLNTVGKEGGNRLSAAEIEEAVAAGVRKAHDILEKREEDRRKD